MLKDQSVAEARLMTATLLHVPAVTAPLYLNALNVDLAENKTVRMDLQDQDRRPEHKAEDNLPTPTADLILRVTAGHTASDTFAYF